MAYSSDRSNGSSGAVNIISFGQKEIKEADDPDALRAEKIAEYEEKFNNPYVAAGLGYVDDVIDLQLRDRG